MSLIFFLLLNNYLFENDFSVGTDFYRLPNYYESSYREVIDLNIENFVDIKYDNFSFSSYFDITEPINFDSLDRKSSYGYRKHILQAKEFKFTYNWKFFTLEAGRILSFQENFLESIDGYKIAFKYSFIKGSYLHGSTVTSDDFLGNIHFLDIYDLNYKEKSYNVDLFTISFLINSYKLKISYLNYLLSDESDYRLFSINSDLSYNDFYIVSNFKKEVNLNNDNYKVAVGYKKFGTSFEKFFPLLFNSSIYNLFSRSSYKRVSIYGKYKDLKLKLLGEDINLSNPIPFKYYGLNFEYEFLDYYKIFMTYVYNKDTLLKFYVNNEKLGSVFSFYMKEDFYSAVSKLFYKLKLQKNVSFEVYSTFLYNTYYSFQIRGGFLLNGEL